MPKNKTRFVVTSCGLAYVYPHNYGFYRMKEYLRTKRFATCFTIIESSCSIYEIRKLATKAFMAAVTAGKVVYSTQQLERKDMQIGIEHVQDKLNQFKQCVKDELNTGINH